MSSAPTGNESIRQGLQQAAATAFQRAQAHVDNGTIPDSQNVRRLLQHAASEAVSLARGFQFPDGIPPSVHDSAHVLEGAFEGLWPILKRCLFLWTVGTTILISSMTMYGIFYVLVQPGQMAREPIYFDYSRLAHHPAPSTCPNETTNQCKLPMLMTDKTINMPWAVADIFSQQSQWEYHIEHVVPKPKTEDRILKQGRSYFIEIYLELPESPVNRDIGIVMVQVDLQSSNGTRLATSVRPCRLPHESQWISTIRKSFWLVPLVIGAAQETRRVIVPSFRHFVESADLPLRYATVTLGGYSDRITGRNHLEVTRGEILIGRELSNFQFLLREWFFTCYMIGTLILSTMQIIGLLFLHTLYRLREKQRLYEQLHEEPSEGLDLDVTQLEPEDIGEWNNIVQPESHSEVTGENVPDSLGNQSEGNPDYAPTTDEEPEPMPPPTPSLADEHATASDAY